MFLGIKYILIKFFKARFIYFDLGKVMRVIIYLFVKIYLDAFKFKFSNRIIVIYIFFTIAHTVWNRRIGDTE